MADIDTTRAGALRQRATENLTREDWVDAAWDLLGEAGIDDVRVEPLARRLGVTKGSFYWHFKDRQQLIDALLDRWFAIWDEQMSPGVRDAADPADRIWALFESVIRRNTRGQTVNFRLLSHRDPAIAARIAQRDNRRLEFLTASLRELGFAPEDSLVRGQAYQTIMTGEYLRSGGLPLDERMTRARRFHEMLTSR